MLQGNDFSSATPEKLIASILGATMVELEDLGRPQKYNKDLGYYEKIDDYEGDFDLIDDEAAT